jgi:hypothetical protein
MDSNLDFLIVLSIHAFSNLKTRSGSLNKKRNGGQMGMSDDDTGNDFDTGNAKPDINCNILIFLGSSKLSNI